MFLITLLLTFAIFLFTNLVLYRGSMGVLVGSTALFGISTAVLLAHKFHYRPQENHLGIVYRNGRFKRFVHPNSYDVLLPREHAQKEISLGIRSVLVKVENIMTQDRNLVNMALKIRYRVDLRFAASESLDQLLLVQDEWWESIVENITVNLVANLFIPNYTYNELIEGRIRLELQRRLAEELSEQGNPMGLLFHPNRAVMIQRVRASILVENALQEAAVAPLIGRSAAERARPLVGLSAKSLQATLGAVYAAMAGEIANGANLPAYFAPQTPGNENDIPIVGRQERQQHRELIRGHHSPPAGSPDRNGNSRESLANHDFPESWADVNSNAPS